MRGWLLFNDTLPQFDKSRPFQGSGSPFYSLSIYTLLSRAPHSLQRVCDSLLEMQPKVFVVLHGLMIEASLVGLNADVKPHDPPK